MIKLALVDDHVMLRNSLAILIKKIGGYEVIMEADNGFDFFQQLKAGVVPDLVLLDITMPVIDGVETAILLKQQYPQIKIIALTMVQNEFIILRMLNSGVRGYLLKDCDTSELIEALQEVSAGEFYYNGSITKEMTSRNLRKYDVVMNARERTFLKWACTDLTHKQIAEEMQVSPRTIDTYRDSLFRKLNVNSRVGLAIYAIKNGFVHV
jgi:two-component system invasion response regulator UvrY